MYTHRVWRREEKRKCKNNLDDCSSLRTIGISLNVVTQPHLAYTYNAFFFLSFIHRVDYEIDGNYIRISAILKKVAIFCDVIKNLLYHFLVIRKILQTLHLNWFCYWNIVSWSIFMITKQKISELQDNTFPDIFDTIC